MNNDILIFSPLLLIPLMGLFTKIMVEIFSYFTMPKALDIEEIKKELEKVSKK